MEEIVAGHTNIPPQHTVFTLIIACTHSVGTINLLNVLFLCTNIVASFTDALIIITQHLLSHHYGFIRKDPFSL